MKALVYTGPQTIVLQDAADPIASAGDVLIEVGAVSICGSDMHAYMGHDEHRRAPPLRGAERGGCGAGRCMVQRLVVNPLVTCGVCRDCLSGRENLCAKREIISMPPRQGLPLPRRLLSLRATSLKFQPGLIWPRLHWPSRWLRRGTLSRWQPVMRRARWPRHGLW